MAKEGDGKVFIWGVAPVPPVSDMGAAVRLERDSHPGQDSRGEPFPVSIAMGQPTAEQEVAIVNAQGMHMRPADLFAKLASRFQSDVEVEKEGKSVDGKSIMDLVTLLATQGTKLLIRARGDDAELAIEALAELVSQGFESEEAVDRTS